MSTKKVGYRHLYDPDYDDDYDDNPFHDSEHVCEHDHHDAAAQHKKNDDLADDNPPDLIDVNAPLCSHTHHCNHDLDSEDPQFEYAEEESVALEFPEYPEYAQNTKHLVISKIIKDERSSFRKKLDAAFAAFLALWLLQKISQLCAIFYRNIIKFAIWAATPFRKLYHAYYIPYLVWLGHQLGGPAQAGRVGHISRWIRVVGNILTVCAIILLIVVASFSMAVALGTGAPFWAFVLASVLGAVGIFVNTIGYMIGSAMNHLKIEQYYHEELRQHAENNGLRMELGEDPIALEHGYLHTSQAKRNVLKFRYGHDLNGGSGSVVSILGAAFEMFLTLTGIGIVFFIFSRISALISVSLAPLTNQSRLSVYKRSISKKINSYYELKSKKDLAKHKVIYSLLGKKFNELNINKKHNYSRWVKFRCYRAIDLVYKNATEIESNMTAINQVLHDQLVAIKEEEKISAWVKIKHLFTRTEVKSSKNCFNRDPLRSLHKEKLSVLDSMPMLEGFMRDALEKSKCNTQYTDLSQVVNDFYTAHMDCGDASSSLFILHLKAALLEASVKGCLTSKDITAQTIKNAVMAHADFFSLTKNKAHALNKKIIAHAYPLRGPHGTQIIPDYHANELVNQMIIPYLKNKQAFEHIHQVVHQFYMTDMDTLDASSFLFILHLKCALIKALVQQNIAVENITYEKIKNVMQMQSEYFHSPHRSCKQFFNTPTTKPILDKARLIQTYKTEEPERIFVHQCLLPQMGIC